MQVGKNIRKALKSRGATQAWLAGELGVYRSNVHRWINGGPGPTLQMVARIAKVLDVPVSDLVDGNAA